MTPLREQLHSARWAYRQVRYPGDLAAAVLGEQVAAPCAVPRGLPGSDGAEGADAELPQIAPRLTLVFPPLASGFFGRLGLGLAAAAAVVAFGFSIQRGDLSGVASDSRLDPSVFAWLLPSAHPSPMAPIRADLAQAMEAVTPPQTPGVLDDIEQPLLDSGKFIVELGRDVAHHADALFRMG